MTHQVLNSKMLLLASCFLSSYDSFPCKTLKLPLLLSISIVRMHVAILVVAYLTVVVIVKH